MKFCNVFGSHSNSTPSAIIPRACSNELKLLSSSRDLETVSWKLVNFWENLAMRWVCSRVCLHVCENLIRQIFRILAKICDKFVPEPKERKGITSSWHSQFHENRKSLASWTLSPCIEVDAKGQYWKFEKHIPRKGIARPQSQFPHSCVCELFIYSHVRSWTDPGFI
jgi:hypothetical protein